MELLAKAAHFSLVGINNEGAALGAMVCSALGDELGFDDIVGAWLIVGATLG